MDAFSIFMILFGIPLILLSWAVTFIIIRDIYREWKDQ